MDLSKLADAQRCQLFRIFATVRECDQSCQDCTNPIDQTIRASHAVLCCDEGVNVIEIS